jgi:hypothetical protein
LAASRRKAIPGNVLVSGIRFRGHEPFSREQAVLLATIADSGLSRYQIAKATGIDESALAKFFNGHRGLSMEALNAFGKCLELTIVSRC